ncbi:MAG TPA: hypothetical protein VGL42_08180 [Opitutaceae bacterium]|jgi:hypothetical protein
MKFLPALTLLLAALSPALHAQDTETLVCFRHGEKPAVEIGQINAQGFNRALALPDVLVAHYGQPGFLFAPNPVQDLIGGKKGVPFSDYLRPLATIEPTAIKLGLPVNTSFGFKHIADLETELMSPKYHQAVVFVCWEHHLLANFLQKISSDVNHQPAAAVDWPSSDYDSVYVVKITYAAGGGATLTLAHEQEGLNGQSGTFPSPAKL